MTRLKQRIHRLDDERDGANVTDDGQAHARRDRRAAREAPPACVALAWLLSRPGVTAPIIGATSKRHIDDATSALTIALEDSEASDLERPYVARLMSDY